MNELLRYLVANCSFLWDDGRYRIVSSRAGPGPGDALVVAESDQVRLRFVSCRGVIAIEIEGKDAGRYSLRALCRLLGRTHVDDCDDAGLLRASLADIEVFLGAGSGRLIRI